MVVTRFLRDQAGAVMVEVTLVISLLLILVLGFVDFSFAFYQWNAANKAVQMGARLAAVSTPVAAATILTSASTNDTALIGEPMSDNVFRFECSSTGCGDTGFNQAAFDRLVGRMEAFFPGLDPTRVRIVYDATGLGYWTRPGGSVPTISVRIEGQPFDFFFLPDLPGFDGMSSQIMMPNMQSTRTGEDLSSTYGN